MKIRFEKIPEPGLALSLDGQRFNLIGIDGHVTAEGKDTQLLVWSSPCAHCGEQFISRTPTYSLPASRRCQTHKRPGHPVRQKKEILQWQD